MYDYPSHPPHPNDNHVRIQIEKKWKENNPITGHVTCTSTKNPFEVVIYLFTCLTFENEIIKKDRQNIKVLNLMLPKANIRKLNQIDRSNEYNVKMNVLPTYYKHQVIKKQQSEISNLLSKVDRYGRNCLNQSMMNANLGKSLHSLYNPSQHDIIFSFTLYIPKSLSVKENTAIAIWCSRTFQLKLKMTNNSNSRSNTDFFETIMKIVPLATIPPIVPKNYEDQNICYQNGCNLQGKKILFVCVHS